MSEPTDKEQKPWLFKPGQSGNPSGRPKGAKNQLREDFIKALQQDFEANGPETIAEVRATQPAQYLKVIASILPKEIEVTTNKLDELSDDELIAGIAALQRLVTPEVASGAAAQAGEDLPPAVH